MAHRHRRRVLDLEAPLYVWRARPVAGQEFSRGDVLPWRDLGLDARKVKQIWGQRLIDNEPPPLLAIATFREPPKRRSRPPKAAE